MGMWPRGEIYHSSVWIEKAVLNTYVAALGLLGVMEDRKAALYWRVALARPPRTERLFGSACAKLHPTSTGQKKKRFHVT